MESLPAIVEAAAKGLAGANLTILNGTQGVNDVLAGLVGQGLTVLDLLRKTAAAQGAANGACRSYYGCQAVRQHRRRRLRQQRIIGVRGHP